MSFFEGVLKKFDVTLVNKQFCNQLNEEYGLDHEDILNNTLSEFNKYNSIKEDREKVMRGMNTRESSQKIIEVMRIHYNFIREHSSLGKTPDEQAGINRELGNNKVR